MSRFHRVAVIMEGHDDGRDPSETDQESGAAGLVRESTAAAIRPIPGVPPGGLGIEPGGGQDGPSDPPILTSDGRDSRTSPPRAAIQDGPVIVAVVRRVSAAADGRQEMDLAGGPQGHASGRAGS